MGEESEKEKKPATIADIEKEAVESLQDRYADYAKYNYPPSMSAEQAAREENDALAYHYANVRQELFWKTLIHKLEADTDFNPKGDSTVRDPEAGKFETKEYVAKRQLMDKAEATFEEEFKAAYLQAFPGENVDDKSSHSLRMLWEQRAKDNPAIAPAPSSQQFEEWRETITLDVYKAWATENGMDAKAIEARVDGVLGRAGVTGSAALLNTEELRELQLAALNVQHDDVRLDLQKRAGSKDSAYKYAGHDSGTIEIRAYAKEQNARGEFETLKKANPDSALSSMNNPFESTVSDFDGRPLVIKWQDKNGHGHTSIFVSRDWAHKQAGKQAAELAKDEKTRKPTVPDSSLIGSTSEFGVAMAKLHSDDAIMYAERERLKKATPEKEARKLLEELKSKANDSERESYSAEYRVALEKNLPADRKAEFLKKFDEYTQKPETLEKLENAEKQKQHEENERMNAEEKEKISEALEPTKEDKTSTPDAGKGASISKPAAMQSSGKTQSDAMEVDWEKLGELVVNLPKAMDVNKRGIA